MCNDVGMDRYMYTSWIMVSVNMYWLRNDLGRLLPCAYMKQGLSLYYTKCDVYQRLT